MQYQNSVLTSSPNQGKNSEMNKSLSKDNTVKIGFKAISF